MIIWKAQGVPQSNNAAHPKHTEEEETSSNRNHIHVITSKRYTMERHLHEDI